MKGIFRFEREKKKRVKVTNQTEYSYTTLFIKETDDIPFYLSTTVHFNPIPCLFIQKKNTLRFCSFLWKKKSQLEAENEIFFFCSMKVVNEKIRKNRKNFALVKIQLSFYINIKTQFLFFYLTVGLKYASFA